MMVFVVSNIRELRFLKVRKAYILVENNGNSLLHFYADCCDGSDEAQGRCLNTCKEAGEAALAALKEELTAFEAGYNTRTTYVK
jgi:hypothetical protein